MIGGAILLLAWGAASGILLARIALDLRAAKAATDRARGLSRIFDVAEGRPIPDLRVARQRFSEAHTQAGSRLLTPVRHFPVLGRQLRSIAALSHAASQVAAVGEEAMVEGQELLGQPSGSGAERVRLVTALGELAARTDTGLQPITLGPRKGLVPPLADARNALADDLAALRDQLQRGSTGAKSVSLLLTGPRRYLLFAANNAEMRAGSGMFLSVGELEIDSDGLRLGEMRSVLDVDVPPGSVPLDGDLADRWGWLEPNREWRNLMTSPRFDVAAPLAAEMWAAAGNRPVDGVLAVDPVTLAGLLEATGPVTVDGRQFDKTTVVEELLHGQYLRFGTGERSERQEELGKLARAAFDALDAGGWSVPGLASGLSSAAGGRHLLLWSSRQEEQSGWEALRVAGSLSADSMLLSVVNRGANKLDRFLNVSSEASFTRAGPDTDVTLRVTLRNQVPPGEPDYVLGSDPGSGVAPGVYLGIVTVNLPAEATGARFDDVGQLAVAGSDGATRVIGVQLQLDPGSERIVVARFRLPGRSGEIRVEPSARVPATAWTGPEGEWSDKSAHEISWQTP
ncbi:MAG: DUF4012 domain-containing protein [Acidimicrobiales bacterium]